ncbi:MAG: sugar ABC transporter permease [Erysipelotrichaceae bacterium]|nr:sugar ABC transporter permease [Erysipelotrichaceae bacterium]
MGKLLKTRKSKRMAFALAVLLPFAVWMMVYMLIPLVSVVFYSFTDAKMGYDSQSFVGLYQFRKMFTSATAMISIKNSLKAALVIVPVSLLLSMLTALGLDALSERSSKIYTFAVFLPNIISLTAACLVWRWIYHGQYGVLNFLLNLMGIPSQQFLKSQAQAMYSLCAIHIWSVFGYYAIILLAAIRSIDKSLYEAASLDGASYWTQFFHVTLPMLKNTLLFVGIMLTTSAFMFFTPVQLLTNGTPGTSTYVMLFYIYQQGIEQGNTGFSSAMSLVLMLIILFFSLIQWILSTEREPKPRKKVKTVKEVNVA